MSLLPFLSNLTVSTGIALFGNIFPKAEMRPRNPGNAPCMKTGQDRIALPLGNGPFCPAEEMTYTFSFFCGPTNVSNVGIVSSLVPIPYSSGIGDQTVDYYPITPSPAFTPVQTSNYVSYLSSGSVSFGPNSPPQPVNLCPSIYKFTDANGQQTTRYSVYKFPTASGGSIATILPGPQLPENPNVIATSPTKNGLSNTIYIDINNNSTLYVELGGGRGGPFPVYANGVDFNKKAIPLEPGFVGGSPGVVYGLLRVNKGQVLKVFLGSVGVELDVNSNSLNLNNPFQSGQGGIGTIFGGSNGGGSSYIMRFRNLSDAYANNNGDLIAVAAGGGGASRNASGGNGGSSDDSLSYGQPIKSKLAGSAGGLSNVVDVAPTVLTHRTNGLSGGGGSTTVPGLSSVTDTPERNSSWGQPLSPFEDSGFVPTINGHHGGGSVITFSGSGGGGGGEGYNGGGAGAWNLLTKPNNVHGAGGGGSSMSSLRPVTRDNSNINVYRKQLMPVNDPNQPLYGFGYLVLGVESATQGTLRL